MSSENYGSQLSFFISVNIYFHILKIFYIFHSVVRLRTICSTLRHKANTKITKKKIILILIFLCVFCCFLVSLCLKIFLTKTKI